MEGEIDALRATASAAASQHTKVAITDGISGDAGIYGSLLQRVCVSRYLWVRSLLVLGECVCGCVCGCVHTRVDASPSVRLGIKDKWPIA